VGRDLGAPGSTVKHIESPGSVLARVGAVESCWLSDRQDVQADSAMGLKLCGHGELVLAHGVAG
jgi:hypothetical protein